MLGEGSCSSQRREFIFQLRAGTCQRGGASCAKRGQVSKPTGTRGLNYYWSQWTKADRSSQQRVLFANKGEHSSWLMIYPSVGRDQNSHLGETSQITMGGQTLQREMVWLFFLPLMLFLT